MAAGLAMLLLGGDALVRGASGLASRAGLTPLTIGLTVVAFGTSAPELVVSLEGSLNGLGDIALGNVVGSNIANIALVLGATAVFRPIAIELRLLQFDMPLMILVSVVIAVLIAGGDIQRFTGAIMLAGLGIYLVHVVRQTSRESFVAEIPDKLVAAAERPDWWLLVLIAGGLALLMLGGHLFVSGGTQLARALGVDDSVIAITIIAVGTSLPELATSVLAAIRGHADIAVGNVIGSNLFNLLGVLGASAVAQPIHAGGVGHVDVAVMVGFSALAYPLLKSGRTLSRREGAVLVALYGSYVAWLAIRS